MLIASVIVCVLYLAWVLGLSELSVAMPFAGGPLAYGRRAVGKWFGFLMGWSMFLECLFATFGTALATGGYLAFLLNPAHPSRLVTTAAAIACALVFFVIQYRGVKEQAVIMLWLTYAAIGALVCFWSRQRPAYLFACFYYAPAAIGMVRRVGRSALCALVACDHRNRGARLRRGAHAASIDSARHGTGPNHSGGVGAIHVVFRMRSRTVQGDRRG